jgi:RNA polymerase sigma-70 factor, ECF subfamily
MLIDQAGGSLAIETNRQPQAETNMQSSGMDEPARRSLSSERFVGLTVRYERRVRMFITTLHPSPSDVDEIVQDAWLVAWKKLSTFRYVNREPDEEFVRWLCTIARYEVSKYRRKNAARPLLNEEAVKRIAALQLEEADYFDARYEALLGCIENLRTRDKELIRRRYQEGISARDLADWIGWSIDAVYKSLNRIRTSLLACVERTLKHEEYH